MDIFIGNIVKIKVILEWLCVSSSLWFLKNKLEYVFCRKNKRKENSIFKLLNRKIIENINKVLVEGGGVVRGYGGSGIRF